MNENLFEQVIQSDRGVLAPIASITYRLTQPTKLELIQTALDVNKSLGQDLFTDLKPSVLATNFAHVTRAMAINMLESK